MVSSLNKVTLIGNLGRNPEIRATQDGKEVANFSIATSESWKDKATGERREKTEWHRVVIFSQPLVNLVKNYIKKGSKVYIEGALHTRKWTDASGIEKYTTEVILQNYNGVLMMLDSKNSGGMHSDSGFGGDSSYDSQSSMTGTANDAGGGVQDLEDDIPF